MSKVVKVQGIYYNFQINLNLIHRSFESRKVYIKVDF